MDIEKIKEKQRIIDSGKVKMINLSQGDWFISQDDLYIKVPSDGTLECVEAVSLDRHRSVMTRGLFKDLKVKTIDYRDIDILKSKYLKED